MMDLFLCGNSDIVVCFKERLALLASRWKRSKTMSVVLHVRDIKEGPF